MNTNIVITGIGIVSAIGNDKETVLQSLLKGETGIGEMQFLNSAHHELPVGEVKLSDAAMKDMLHIEQSEELSRTTLMGMLAVQQAIADAQLEKQEGQHAILISGTTVGGMDVTERYFHTFADSNEHTGCLEHHDGGSCTAMIANRFGIFDDYTTPSTACSSAANAIMLGARLIKAGKADVVVAGGTEALSRFHLNGFNSLMILDHEPCKPFDENRAGLNLGEGAAYVVLESEEAAKARNANIMAYLTGYGNACDAFHQTASSPNGEGAFLAMQQALAMAGITAAEVDYVNAHGTGTPNNDASESAALRRIFVEKMPPVSSTKGFTGHTTSASGSIEAVICLLAMKHHFIPQNLGWQHPMTDGIIPTLGTTYSELHHVLCNAFGFGGNDSALLFSSHPASTAVSETWTDKEIRQLAKVEIGSEEGLDEIRNYVKPMEVRRMGRIMKSSLLSSLKVLEQAGITTPDAIITGTALGCLENSEKLLQQLCDEGEGMLKQTLFMQSTHNTIGSSIAIRTQCHGYNTTYTQGRDSLRWALLDAELLLSSGQAKTVLVGLHDETTPLYRQALSPLGIHDLQPLYDIAIVLTCGD